MLLKHFLKLPSFLANASTLALKRSSIGSLDLVALTNVVTDAARLLIVIVGYRCVFTHEDNDIFLHVKFFPVFCGPFSRICNPAAASLPGRLQICRDYSQYPRQVVTDYTACHIQAIKQIAAAVICDVADVF